MAKSHVIPDRLYIAIGQAVTMWPLVEDQIFNLFLHTLTGGRATPWSEAKVYHAAYYSIQSQNAQLDVLNAAFKTRFEADKSMLSEWRSLYREVKKNRTIRNNVAHYTNLNYERDPVTKEPLHVLTPSLGRIPLDGHVPSEKIITMEDLEEIPYHLGELLLRLQEFTVKVIRHTPRSS
ncbi:MAG: hypothetical protein RIC87_18165 [Kiloniellales bacterium]